MILTAICIQLLMGPNGHHILCWQVYLVNLSADMFCLTDMSHLTVQRSPGDLVLQMQVDHASLPAMTLYQPKE